MTEQEQKELKFVLETAFKVFAMMGLIATVLIGLYICTT